MFAFLCIENNNIIFVLFVFVLYVCAQFRVFDYSVGTLKQIPLFTFPVQVALESMFILKRYAYVFLDDPVFLIWYLYRFGMAGLAGVLLRRDFVEAVETLKKISGLVL